MSLREDMDRLEIAVHSVSQGINAIEAMALGLSCAKDPYADGFSALSVYLIQADREVHKYLTACFDTI